MACKNHPDRDAVAACVACGAELCAECDNVAADGKSYCSEDLSAAATAPVVAPPVAPPAVTPAPVVAPPPAVAAPPPPVAAGSGNMVLAAIGYVIWICALIVVVTEKNDPEVKYHGWNGLFWGLGYTVVSLALLICGVVLHDVPGVRTLLRLVTKALPLAFLILSIVFASNAYNRKPVNIPVISDLARKQAGV